MLMGVQRGHKTSWGVSIFISANSKTIVRNINDDLILCSLITRSHPQGLAVDIKGIGAIIVHIFIVNVHHVDVKYEYIYIYNEK